MSAELKALFKTGRHVREYRFRHAAGRRLWMRDELWLVRGAAGQPREAIGYWVDISERKALAERAEHLAYYDELTGLPNRRLFRDRLCSRHWPPRSATASRSPC